MKFIRKNIKIITIILTIILVIFLILLKIYLNNKANLIKEETPAILNEIVEEPIQKEEVEESKELVYVDIKGAVITPGVYEIESDKKVIDVVNIAGGLTDNADTTLINLAKQVSNEMVIIIYTKEELETAKKEDTIIKIIDKECICPEIKNDACIENIKEESNSNDTASNKVNINIATLEELLTLTGIGESKAQAIIEHRNEIGKFTNIEELKEVSGIGEALYEKIKDNITI